MHEPAQLTRRAIATALPIAALTRAAAQTAGAKAATTDPVFAQIEVHRALRIRANVHPGPDKDPAYQAAQDAEEAAIQALGDIMPTSIAGAVAQLRYMAEVEAPYADDRSPLLRTVLTVARGLADLEGRGAI